jgi:hypothetical protein
VVLANLGSESETCVGSSVHLVGVSISSEKNFYRLPFTPPSLVRRFGPSPRPPPPPPPPHETTKPTPPNRSAQHNHAKAGTSGPNTSVIGTVETPLHKNTLEKPLAISNQQGKKLAKNNISTPRTTGKKSLEKPSAISKLYEEKLAKNKSSTPHTAGKQALKKPSSAISKQQEKEIAVNKTSKRPTRK